MSRLFILLILSLANVLQARQPPPQEARLDALEKRLIGLESRLDGLEATLLRLETLEPRLLALERLMARSGHLSLAGDEQPAPPAYRALPDMPYDEGLCFVAAEVETVGTRDAGGRLRHRLKVTLLEIPDEVLRTARKVQSRGRLALVPPTPLPESVRAYQMSIENLNATEAASWHANLSPEIMAASDHAQSALPRIAFVRVPTSRTFRDGYEGHEGSVRPWRGKLHWYENDVFFREEGVLRVMGHVAARHHIRLLHPLATGGTAGGQR